MAQDDQRGPNSSRCPGEPVEGRKMAENGREWPQNYRELPTVTASSMGAVFVCRAGQWGSALPIG